VWDPNNYDDTCAVQEHNLGRKDIFVIGVPGTLDKLPQPFDITGTYHPDLTTNNFGRRARHHYSTAPIYQRLWGWSHGVADGLNPKDHNVGMNTLVFQETYWKHSEGHKFETRVRGKGHWGDDVYPGCADIRNGSTPGHLQDYNYKPDGN